jgi:sulfate transport system ATP-binding protein
MAITVRNVTKRFGDFVALDDVSVDVQPGSLTALLGPSGGGKSTLLRIIAGLEHPDSGVVEIAGAEATHLPPQRRNVGFVFQHYAAFKHMSVFRNVAFGLQIRKRPKDEIKRRVYELLELVHLEQFADRLPSQLLLLDEPFGALDAQVRKELRKWLRRLHDEVHVTTVFVTHDQEEAMDVADHIVVIANGKVEQVGTPDDLYEEPANDFVMSFLGPVTKLDGQLVRPHDLELLARPEDDTVEATVMRVARLGFEVRIEIVADGVDVWAQLTRAAATELGVKPGSVVYVRPTTGAVTRGITAVIEPEPALREAAG